MNTLSTRLDIAIRAVAPIIGVSIGRVDDRETWRIDFEPAATEEQRAAAQVVLEAIDPSEPVPVPASISRRQLLLGLVGLELITGEEALAAAQTGAVPAAIDAYFGNLPPDQELAARITWASMTVCERNHPLVGALAEANQLSSEQIDDAFRAWAHQ